MFKSFFDNNTVDYAISQDFNKSFGLYIFAYLQVIASVLLCMFSRDM